MSNATSVSCQAEPVTSLADSLATVGDRWTLLIVDALLESPLRFGELSRHVSGIAPNVLIQRLRDLQADGLVLAAPYSRRPLRLVYSLSDTGRRLRPVIGLLAEWSARRTGAATPAHDACGTTLETRAWCPTCERIVDPEQVDLHHV